MHELATWNMHWLHSETAGGSINRHLMSVVLCSSITPLASCNTLPFTSLAVETSAVFGLSINAFLLSIIIYCLLCGTHYNNHPNLILPSGCPKYTLLITGSFLSSIPVLPFLTYGSKTLLLCLGSYRYFLTLFVITPHQLDDAKSNIFKPINYFRDNNLFVNLNETKCIIFSADNRNSYNPIIKVDNETLIKSSSTKFLWLTIDQKQLLDWSQASSGFSLAT